MLPDLLGYHLVGSLQLWHLLLLCLIPAFFLLSFTLLLGGKTASVSHILCEDGQLAAQLKEQLDSTAAEDDDVG